MPALPPAQSLLPSTLQPSPTLWGRLPRYCAQCAGMRDDDTNKFPECRLTHKARERERDRDRVSASLASHRHFDMIGNRDPTATAITDAHTRRSM